MTKDKKLDEFLKRIGIKLLPFQKEILKQVMDGEKIYSCYPSNIGRINAKLLMQVMDTIFAKGETNNDHV